MVWLSQMASSPQMAEGCSGFGWPGVFGSRYGHLHLAGGVVHRIEHRQIVAALFGRSVDQAVGVDVRIALIGGDFVVQIGLRVGPVPLRDDDVALDALRARRRFDGNSPFSMRVVQSPNSAVARSGPSWLRPPIIALPAWPDCTRRSHAVAGESRFLNSAGMVRVYSLPSWWQDSQLSVLTRCIHCPCVLMFGEMPLPLGPVPGNSFFSGTFSSAYQ